MTTVVDDKPTVVLPALKAADRCDRCGAQAFVRVIMVWDDYIVDLSKGELLFCGHHWDNGGDAVAVKCDRVQDEREKIN